MFGNKAQKPSRPAKTAGIDGDSFASNEERVAWWFVGSDWVALTWLTAIHNERRVAIREKAGKSTVTVGHDVYGDLAGHCCMGLVDRIQKIEVGDEIIWTGDIARPTNPADPDYWRAEIATDIGTFYLYWGRADQPVDDVLLGPLGAANADLEHPAYRNQCYLVCKQLYFGESSTSAPNVRVFLRRAAKPQLGVFNESENAQGESLVAAILELLTDPIFGAELPTELFDAAEWEALSAEVIARAGYHSPEQTREQPAASLIPELLRYFDGFIKLQNGKLVPGIFPHDGTVPAELTELSHHDFTQKPDISAPSASRTINSVTVSYRDKDKLLEERSVTETDGGQVGARSRVAALNLEMPAIVDVEQATAFAAEMVATGSVPGSEGKFRVRRARLVDGNGDALNAGDNFQLDYLPYELDQVCRIVALTESFDGSMEVEFIAEPGVFPLPYTAPTTAVPDLGKALPEQIVEARIFELTPDLAGDRLGLPISILAMRPKALIEGSAGIDDRSVTGFRAWYGSTNAAYDPLVTQTKWAVKGQLNDALPATSADVAFTVALDAGNIDEERIGSQSDEDRDNDQLLAIIGNEVFTVGNVSISGMDYTLTCKRERQGTVAAAHAVNDAVWLVFRDDLVVIKHAQFIEDTTRYFKLQPFTRGSILDLSQAAEIEYTFRDRDPEKPQTAFDTIPGAPRYVGVPYLIEATVTDVNGDLESARVYIKFSDGSRTLISNIEATAAQGAQLNISTYAVFPKAGDWTVEIQAFDTLAENTAESSSLAVTQGNGTYGDPDPGAPATPTGLALTPGYGSLLLEWDDVPEANYYQVSVYDSDPSVSGEPPAVDAQVVTNSYLLTGLDSNTAKWFQVRAVKSLVGSSVLSSWSAVANGTSLAVINGTYYGMVEPANPGAEGAIWFDTGAGKRIMRWNGTAWENAQYILTVSELIGVIAANQVIANTANIADAIITSAKIYDLDVSKLTSGTIDTAVLTLDGTGGRIESSNFNSGTTGFRLRGNGDAELNNVTVRGNLRSSNIIVDDDVWIYRSDALSKPASPVLIQRREDTSSSAESSGTLSFRGRNASGASTANRVLPDNVTFAISVICTASNVAQNTSVKVQTRLNGGSWSDLFTAFGESSTPDEDWIFEGAGSASYVASVGATDNREFRATLTNASGLDSSFFNLTITAYNWI